MMLSRGSGPRAAAGFRERVALFGAFLGAFFAAGIPQRLREGAPIRDSPHPDLNRRPSPYQGVTGPFLILESARYCTGIALRIEWFRDPYQATEDYTPRRT